jgi:hypothetical protein
MSDSHRGATHSANTGNPRSGNVQQAAWSGSNNAPSNQAAPRVASQPTGFWSQLTRPLTAQTDDAPVRRPEANQTASDPTAAAQSDQDTDESEHVPQLLLPFYQTSGSPSSNADESPAAKARSGHHGADIESTVRDSQLTRQLAMTTGGHAQDEPDDPALRGDQEAWDGGGPSSSELKLFKTTSDTGKSKTVAYLQEPTPATADGPEPEKIPLPGEDNPYKDDQPANGDSTSGESSERKNGEGDSQSGENGEGKKKDGKLATAEKLGKKPEDRSLDFLRTETVLLKPGKYQFDIGVSYSIQERNFPILFRTIDPTNPVDDTHVLTTDGHTLSFSADGARFKSRELEMPLQLRYGLFKRVQVFIAAPVGWSNTEVDLTGRDEFKNDGGIGDISFGATAQLQDGQADCPYVIGSFVATAPTGGDPFTDAALFSPSAPALGNGFWKLGGNLLFIQPMDPVTFFYGTGIRGSFEHEYIGANFEPGLEYTYTFGFGFAINEKVTISSQLFGEYQSRLQVNGQGLEGSSQEPISLQLAATIARPCDRLVEPFVQFGLTDDAVAANIGITWTY